MIATMKGKEKYDKKKRKAKYDSNHEKKRKV